MRLAPVRFAAALVVLQLVVPPPSLAQTHAERADSASRCAKVAGPAGDVVERCRFGARIGVIDSSRVGLPAARTISETLVGRVAGLSVLRNDGGVGMGSRVRLRGPTGWMPAAPLVVVDGIRTVAGPNAIVEGIGGVAPSVLDDLEAEEVARIDVLPGAAAATRHGTDASAGVLSVVTREGTSGPLRVGAFAEGGVIEDPGGYAANFGALASPTTVCSRVLAADGICVINGLRSWNPLESASPFRTARSLHAGVSASGGSARTGLTYFASATGHSVDGVESGAHGRRIAERVNLGWTPSPAFTAHARLWRLDGRNALPSSGNTDYAVRALGMLGTSVDDPATRGYLLHTPDELEQRLLDQEVGRTLLSATARWRPASWLAVDAIAGRDRLTRGERRGPGPGPSRPTDRGWKATLLGDLDTRVTTVGVSTTTSIGFGRLSSSTTVGVQGVDTRDAQDTELRVPASADSPEATAREEMERRQRERELFIAPRFAWRTLDGGASVRFGQRDAFDVAPDPVRYIGGDLRWSPDERFALRAAYGEAADARAPQEQGPAIGTSLTTAPDLGQPLTGAQTREIESGVDLTMARGRLVASVTAYRAMTRLPSTIRGRTTRWRSDGLEAELSTTPVRTSRLEWVVRATASFLDNEVTRLVDPSAFPGVTYRERIGYPLHGVWALPIGFRDANGDGKVASSEIVALDSARFRGAPFPTRELGLTSTLRLGRAFQLWALVDHHGGAQLFNGTEELRCEFYVCKALYDPNAAPDKVAQAAAPVHTSISPSTDGFFEDASFTRLREVAVSWQAPERLARAIGAGSVALTLSGRNLALWTGYSGRDPEVRLDGSTTYAATDLFLAPLPRSIALRLDVSR